MSSFTVLALASLVGAVTCGNGGSYVLPGNYGENSDQFVPSAVPGPGQTPFSAIDFSSHFTDQSFRRNQNGGYTPRTVSYRPSQPYYRQRNPTVVMPIAPRASFRGPTQQAMHRQPYRQLTRQKFNSAGANSYVAPGGYAGPGYETGIDQSPAPEGYVTSPDVNYEVEVEQSEQPEEPEQYGPRMPAPPQTYEEEQEETDSEYGSESTDSSTLAPPASGFAQTGYGSVGTSYMKRNVKVRSTGETEKRKGAQTA